MKVLVLLMPLVLVSCAGKPGVTAEELAQVHAGMTREQVEAVLGRPQKIETSALQDQTLSGEIDYYLARDGGQVEVIFVDRTVFQIKT